MKSLMSKSLQVRRILHKRIVSGKYEKQEPIPSERLLAESFDVSHATVREAVSQLVAEGLLYRVQGKGTFVNEAQTAGDAGIKAINLYSKDTHGLSERDPFVAEVLCGIHKALSKDCNLPVRLVGVSEETGFAEIFRRNESEFADCGAIFAAYPLKEEDLAAIRDFGLKAASVGKPCEGSGMPFVELDHFNGMRKAAELLASLGHKRMVMLDEEGPYPHLKRRREGFESSLASLGCEGRVVRLDGYTVEDAYAKLDAFMKTGFEFTAMVCVGDRPTVGVHRLLSGKGLKVPDDVSIVSYSDYSWIDCACGLRFTKLRQSVESLAESACKILLGRLDVEEIWQDAFIEEGASCRAPAREAAR